MKPAQVQQMILEQTGIKTSVSKMSGSMKAFLKFSVMKSNGEGAKFDFIWRYDFIKQFKADSHSLGPFCDDYCIQIPLDNFDGEEITNFRKGLKPPTKKAESKQRTWGSKNSQMRLDKATARYAKKLRKGGCARYC